jgi:uncharacterized protein (DUF1697 family)
MRHAAFLRGINLGGRRVTGEQLRAPFEALGFRQVASFLASGNVAFDTDDVDDLETRIEAALRTSLGYPVETFVRTATGVAEVIARHPFDAHTVAASDGKPQVTFLRETPVQQAVDAAMAHATDQDRLSVIGREWYWLPSGGMSQSPLDVRAIEQALGRGTTRTLATVTRLYTKLLAGSAEP